MNTCRCPNDPNCGIRENFVCIAVCAASFALAVIGACWGMP